MEFCDWQSPINPPPHSLIGGTWGFANGNVPQHIGVSTVFTASTPAWGTTTRTQSVSKLFYMAYVHRIVTSLLRIVTNVRRIVTNICSIVTNVRRIVTNVRRIVTNIRRIVTNVHRIVTP